ncbi:MAG: hypothetical protein NXI25_24980 [bacterium]|nr:hypothetical protein [bacterium]
MDFDADFLSEYYKAVDILTRERLDRLKKRQKVDSTSNRAGERLVSYKVVCHYCQEEFSAKSNAAKTCSDRCKKRLSLERKEAKRWFEGNKEPIQEFNETVNKL